MMKGKGKMKKMKTLNGESSAKRKESKEDQCVTCRDREVATLVILEMSERQQRNLDENRMTNSRNADHRMTTGTFETKLKAYMTSEQTHSILINS